MKTCAIWSIEVDRTRRRACRPTTCTDRFAPAGIGTRRARSSGGLYEYPAGVPPAGFASASSTCDGAAADPCGAPNRPDGGRVRGEPRKRASGPLPTAGRGGSWRTPTIGCHDRPGPAHRHRSIRCLGLRPTGGDSFAGRQGTYCPPSWAVFWAEDSRQPPAPLDSHQPAGAPIPGYGQGRARCRRSQNGRPCHRLSRW